MIQGPRIWSAPLVLPSRGNSVLMSARSTVRSCTPKIGRPCIAVFSIFSSRVRLSQSQVGPPTVPIGLVSVMPQACWTRVPFFISRSIMNLGAADPPMVAALRGGRSRPSRSQYWKCASHTVGTPAESVTPSRSIRSWRTAGSFTAENTNLIPAIAPA